MSRPAESQRPRSLYANRLVALWVCLSALLLIVPAGAGAHGADVLADEPIVSGIGGAVDFEVAPNGDLYVAKQSGALLRYNAVEGFDPAHPRYDLTPQTLYSFSVTQQFDRGFVGFTLDADFPSEPYLYALITRGSTPWVEAAPNGNPNGVRRTAAVVRLTIAADGTATDPITILGNDAAADPDSTCKPYSDGQAAAHGETDDAPNGVRMTTPSNDAGGAKIAEFDEDNLYPDGNLSTRDDGAYDCIPSDSDTHGLGDIVAAPDGSLLLSVGDASPWQGFSRASFRAYNLESYAGKILRIDRSGHGVEDHPFCPDETDLTRVCTKIWAIGLRNAFRITLLPSDPQSGGDPVLAIGNVGNYAVETLTVAHAGDNIGWPCWEGTYWNWFFADSRSGGGLITAWGGPLTTPTVSGMTSCQQLTDHWPDPITPATTISRPTVEYYHSSDPDQSSAAIIAGPRVEAVTGADPKVALPDEWLGSLVFGDYAQGWLMRLSPDPDDSANVDSDGGLLTPADEGRAPTVNTDATAGTVDPLLDQIADAPVTDPDDPWFRLTMRQGPDGALWYLRFGSDGSGGLHRLRTAPLVTAEVERVTGECGTTTGGTVTLVAADAGPDATYAWDVDGDGVDDAGRTSRTLALPVDDIKTLTARGSGWVRLTVRSGDDQATAMQYICQGPTPQLSITEPADHAQVVLGKPVVVKASRPDGDAANSGVSDDDLVWEAWTHHGGQHIHPLKQRTGGTELVDGTPQLQFTVTPDAGHELGSWTRVRISSPTATGGGATVILEPKPVSVALRSSPAGATIAMARDVGESTVEAAPGDVTVAAGYFTSLTATQRFASAGHLYAFTKWSDGPTTAARTWTVPDDGGDAPVAEYQEITPTPTVEPAPTQLATPTPTPTAIEQRTPISDDQPTPTPTPADEPPPTPVDQPTPTPTAEASIVLESDRLLLPATGDDVRGSVMAATARITTARRGRGQTVISGTLQLPRAVDATALALKLAVRNDECRWWRFARSRFAGQSRRRARNPRTTICVQAPAWRLVRATWSGAQASFAVTLNRALPAGSYAVRVRVQRGTTTLGERVASARVR
ncbi:MAG: PQQ-dependent sugar dehydrogenase [Patulibacter sp.]